MIRLSVFRFCQKEKKRNDNQDNLFRMLSLFLLMAICTEKQLVTRCRGVPLELCPCCTKLRRCDISKLVKSHFPKLRLLTYGFSRMVCVSALQRPCRRSLSIAAARFCTQINVLPALLEQRPVQADSMPSMNPVICFTVSQRHFFEFSQVKICFLLLKPHTN